MHTSRVDKKAVVGTLELDVASQGVTLDVTVVIHSSDAANILEWYFSSYALDAIYMHGVPTSAPALPTVAPTKGSSNGTSPTKGSSTPPAFANATMPTSRKVSNNHDGCTYRQ
jgi:hypothetical protein